MQNKAKKKLSGIVTKVQGANTAKVRVERKMTHPLYKKIIKSHKSYLVENGLSDIVPGDVVIIEECSPKSKNKTFKILKKIDKK